MADRGLQQAVFTIKLRDAQMDELTKDFKALIESGKQLAKLAYSQYQPIVEQYIAGNCTDSRKIGYTLEYILDFCFDEQMLLLYRRLCRHLYSFDMESTAYYINAYREMWDEEGKHFGNKSKD